MARIRKEDYISEETKQLEVELANRLAEDKEKKMAQKLVDSIPPQRKQFVLEILSRELAAK